MRHDTRFLNGKEEALARTVCGVGVGVRVGVGVGEYTLFNKGERHRSVTTSILHSCLPATRADG